MKKQTEYFPDVEAKKKSYSQIEALIGCSRHTIAKVSKQMKQDVT